MCDSLHPVAGIRSVQQTALLAASSEDGQFLPCTVLPCRPQWCLTGSMLMCICRTLQGSPVMLSGVRLMLPQPEFDYLEASARSASAFVVELLGAYISVRHKPLCCRKIDITLHLLRVMI
jgi:hypothetical protein